MTMDSTYLRSPAATTPSSPSRNPLAYQQKLIDRSASKSSLSSSVSNGITPSASVRRYPMPAGSSHRHTASYQSGGLFGGPATPTRGSGNTPISDNDRAGSPSSSYSSRPLTATMATSSTAGRFASNGAAASPTAFGTASSRANRHYSMPPAPREVASSPPPSQPSSPQKTAGPFPRPGSPTKPYGGAYPRSASPSRSPGKDDASWINGGNASPSHGGGSFWSYTGPSAAPATPTAVHLGGVGDLKRSSVGALKMMGKFTAKSSDSPSGASDGSHTRMTVGRTGSSYDTAKTSRDRMKEEDDTSRHTRLDRIEASEDQDGEIYIPGITTGAEDVSGLHGRIRLARRDIAGPGTIALGRTTTSATSSLPFASSSKWMDTQRHLLQAYEYLCHCGEAKQWLESCIDEELGPVVSMENEMRDGVFLAKVARHFEPQCVPRIFVHPKLQYRHTDNVNHFFRFVEQVGLPVFFHFELTDLYEKKNFPKVVYCIHALSHILARQGRSNKVSDLVGKLEFTDDQLQQTQRGLDAAGVAMPAFGGLGKALAKEMNVEPEPEPEPEETEEERLARELQDCTASVVALQTVCRSYLARSDFRRRRQAAREEAERRRRDLEEEQRRAEEERQRQEELRLYEAEQRRLHKEEERRRQLELEAEEQRRQLILEDFAPRLQAAVRGASLRRNFQQKLATLSRLNDPTTAFQAVCRGHLARRTYQILTSNLLEATPDIIKCQAAVRGILARRQLLSTIRALRGVDETVVYIQAQCRGVLARRRTQQLQSAMQRAEVVRSVIGLQSLARAVLARRQHREQGKLLSNTSSNITGLQAHIRGLLVRQEYDWWRDHLHESEPVVIHLQSLLRGVLARRQYNSKLRHYHEHMDKVVKIQSLFRGRQQGEQYRSLTMGKNVPVSTIKNFGHLLNDSDHDFEDEIEVERLRKLVVSSIRGNQTLENDVNDLDTKIALLVKNKIGIEELVKAKHERGLLRQREAADATLAQRNSVLAAAGDPFADHVLADRETRKKLELYQELFHSLQTRPEYLARLFASVGRMDMSDRQRKQVEKIVLTLFGYAQKAREEFLLLKLFQRSVAEELVFVRSPQEFLRGSPPFIKLVVQYNRGAKERQYLRELLSPLVRGIIEDEGLDLETDPCAIYRGTINQEEMETGRASSRPVDVDFQTALADPFARTVFIRHLQALRGTTEAFLGSITASTQRMPFGIRYIGREVFRALQASFPDVAEDQLIKLVGHLVYYRYLNPAIVAPETFDVIEKVVNPLQRKNLAEVSKMLIQISNGKLFSDDNPYLQPLNEYVSQASERFTQWLYAVIDVPDAEIYFNADEFADHTLQGRERPVIYISPNEIYSLHLLVAEELDTIAPNAEDPLRTTLEELGSAPQQASQELNDARLTEITLTLVNRRTSLKDPEADTKALFVETKRLVLSLLKVQSGKTLMDVFLSPVSEQDEMTWEEIARMEGQPSADPHHPQTRSPLLEDVRQLTFAELKARTLENMLRLEQMGKVSRATGYQEMLNSIAMDIRQKHRKRLQRQNEKQSMMNTLVNLEEKKRYLEEQIASYHSYVDKSMQTMVKKGGKKKFVMPFSQQYFHLRHLKQQGKLPNFGSYKYTADQLRQKGILLKLQDEESIPIGFEEKLTLTISSDEAGLFTIEAAVLCVKVASTDLRIEDLLERQHNSRGNELKIDIGGQTAFLNLNLLIHLLNRKFYA